MEGGERHLYQYFFYATNIIAAFIYSIIYCVLVLIKECSVMKCVDFGIAICIIEYLWNMVMFYKPVLGYTFINFVQ